MNEKESWDLEESKDDLTFVLEQLKWIIDFCNSSTTYYKPMPTRNILTIKDLMWLEVTVQARLDKANKI